MLREADTVVEQKNEEQCRQEDLDGESHHRLRPFPAASHTV